MIWQQDIVTLILALTISEPGLVHILAFIEQTEWALSLGMFEARGARFGHLVMMGRECCLAWGSVIGTVHVLWANSFDI